MIVYNQAFDKYHCLYRIITILDYFSGEELEVERLRIWDFYLAFPREVSFIRFGTDKEDREVKKIFPKKNNPYESLINPKKLFERMQPYQINALKTLASIGIINKDFFKLNLINEIDKNLLKDFSKEFEELSTREQNIVKIMTSYFYRMPLYGNKGLKDRTHLIEHRYDA